MDASTFLDTSVVRQLRSDYYAVKLNAETRDTIRFRDKVFVFKPEFKANEIALALLNGKMGYPSFVLMDEEYKILQPLSGFQTTEELMPLLRFYGSNAYKNMKLEDYLKP
jgi:thioredoxin-related protein